MISDLIKNQVWEKGAIIPGYDAGLWRSDDFGASVIKCCYAATGMYMTAAAAILRE